MNNELNTNTVKEEEQKEVNGMKNPRPFKVGKVTTYDIMTIDRAIGAIKNKKVKECIINYIARIETERSLEMRNRKHLENENKALLLALEALGSKHDRMKQNIDCYIGDRLHDACVNRLSKSSDNRALEPVWDGEIDY